MQEAVCNVCIHHCRLTPNQWGICKARKNENGAIVCANYGKITSLALDPIEKKPLRRFFPGSMILSVGSFGCNLRCPFCQNHEISMAGENDFDTEYLSPKDLCALAVKLRTKGNIGVAFTYNEPFISYEYVLDTSKLLKEAGMKSVLVTNGTVSLPILEQLLPYVDAMNIDLKGFTSHYYKSLGGDLAAVQAVIERSVQNCHVELTTLIVPDENDSPDEMEKEAAYIASVSREIPLHISRFFPCYHMTDKTATDVGHIYQLADIARTHLPYVYTGNC